MTSIKEALEIVRCMIQGDQIEAAIVDTDTMASLGDVVRASLAQLDSADVRSAPWRYEVQHGPDGEADYAWVYDEANNLICTAKTHHAKAIVDRLSTGLLPNASPGNGAEKVREHPIETAQRGFNAWAAKEHNKKWFKRIDGTPIPNDLVVCIAMEFSALHSTSAAGETTSSDGGVEGHARDIADSGRASVRGDDGAPESPYPTKAGIKPGPSDPSSTRSEVTVGDFAGWCESNGYFTSVSFIRALLDQFEIRRKK